jgi:hypothetical protein
MTTAQAPRPVTASEHVRMAQAGEAADLPDSRFLVIRPEHLQVQLPLKVYLGGIGMVVTVVFTVAAGWFSLRNEMSTLVQRMGQLADVQTSQAILITKQQEAFVDIIRGSAADRDRLSESIAKLATEVSRLQGRLEADK